MASISIGGLTEETTPSLDGFLELETPVPNSRKVKIRTIHELPLELGKPLKVTEGSNGCFGKATLGGGGVQTITTNKVTANSRIFITVQETGIFNGTLRITARTPGTSFQVSSSDTGDTCDFAWMIIEPV